MRSAEDIIRISMSNLSREEMIKGKVEAISIANRDQRKWMEVYYERNLADPLRHYDPSIPKNITYIEFDFMIDRLDLQFRYMLEGL